jgi:hypothetical protein
VDDKTPWVWTVKVELWFINILFFCCMEQLNQPASKIFHLLTMVRRFQHHLAGRDPACG